MEVAFFCKKSTQPPLKTEEKYQSNLGFAPIASKTAKNSYI